MKIRLRVSFAKKGWKSHRYLSASPLTNFLAVLTSKGGKVTTKDIVVFSRQFSTMVNAGLPIMQGLSIVAEQAENPDFPQCYVKGS